MKEYFSKLLTEQERAGSKNRSVKWSGRLKYDPDSDYDDQINYVSMSRHGRQYGWNGKSLTDVLSPLRGYLRKNVGRKWDDVYSELCRGLDRRSVSGLHVFTHLWQYVEKNTVMIDGNVCYVGTGFREKGYVPIEESYRYEQFYVHPEDGILCAAPIRSYRARRNHQFRQKEDENVIEIGLGKAYRKMEGIWYYTEYAKVDKYDGYHGIILKKRQLNKKELRYLGLKNSVVKPVVEKLPKGVVLYDFSK